MRQQNQAILRAVWEAPAGVHATLEMLPDNMLIYDAYFRKILGFSHDYFDYHTAYEESEIPGYKLTTRDGTVYKIEKPVVDYGTAGRPPIHFPIDIIKRVW